MINYDEMTIEELNKLVIKKFSKDMDGKPISDENTISTMMNKGYLPCEKMDQASVLATLFLANLESNKTSKFLSLLMNRAEAKMDQEEYDGLEYKLKNNYMARIELYMIKLVLNPKDLCILMLKTVEE